MDDPVLALLIQAARDIGWPLPENEPIDSIEAFQRACFARLDHIQGGQDRAHAKNGVRSAITAAHEGNAEYARAGLWEAAKVIHLEEYDRDVTRLSRPSHAA